MADDKAPATAFAIAPDTRLLEKSADFVEFGDHALARVEGEAVAFADAHHAELVALARSLDELAADDDGHTDLEQVAKLVQTVLDCAAAFGYPLAGAIAARLLRMIDGDWDVLSQKSLLAHTQAVVTCIEDDIREENDPRGGPILESLNFR